jgi:hypothetical protein
VEQQRDHTCLALLFSGQRAKRTVAYVTNAYVPLLYTLCRPTNSTNSTQGGTEKDWGLKSGDWRPGPGSLGQTNRQTDRRTDRMTDIFCRPHAQWYGTSPPGQRAGVVHGTLLLVTYVMYAVVGRMGRGWVLHKGTPPLSSQPLLLSLCCP